MVYHCRISSRRSTRRSTSLCGLSFWSLSFRCYWEWSILEALLPSLLSFPVSESWDSLDVEVLSTRKCALTFFVSFLLIPWSRSRRSRSQLRDPNSHLYARRQICCFRSTLQLWKDRWLDREHRRCLLDRVWTGLVLYAYSFASHSNNDELLLSCLGRTDFDSFHLLLHAW